MKILLFIILFAIPCASIFWISYKGESNTKLNDKNKKENQDKNENETTSKGRK